MSVSPDLCVAMCRYQVHQAWWWGCVCAGNEVTSADLQIIPAGGHQGKIKNDEQGTGKTKPRKTKHFRIEMTPSFLKTHHQWEHESIIIT